MTHRTPREIAEYAVQSGVAKARLPLLSLLALGFGAGAFIALGYLLSIRVTASVPAEWGSFASLLGASVFPLGLILVIIGGGELLTGNMMTLAIARMSRQITTWQVAGNWLWITISNFAGALFVAYFFGHVVGLTESGPYLEKTIGAAAQKLDESFLQAFISGIGCNWLVSLAVWLAYASNSTGGKIAGIWFPTMAFVAIGFQHVVANMFVIPAAIFAGQFTWMEYAANFVPVFLGNAVGGSLFVGGIYWMAYLRNEPQRAVPGMRAGHQTVGPKPKTGNREEYELQVK
ncbi:formate/nitrite transporter family protein [Paenibacillus sp. J2TS4]|uniref:formate/nitrite transporter family protein n=1 Tax=Paenibacillus sp. J2TS4 TaxID=2807194 RepID=UPI001B042914|nr:formate/nitrite transporter family protein [Paenibacillus sp. J2TS4]GIP34159.1 putative transporter YrhG [Paenibacillus sp. J2TS4]